MATYTCAHCGQTCGDYAGGYGGVTGDDGKMVPLCHPNVFSRPDCYRRVTVYREPIGALKNMDPKPAGVLDVITPRKNLRQWFQVLQEGFDSLTLRP